MILHERLFRFHPSPTYTRSWVRQKRGGSAPTDFTRVLFACPILDQNDQSQAATPGYFLAVFCCSRLYWQAGRPRCMSGIGPYNIRTENLTVFSV